ncbi:tetratricopeptide repeat protein [Nannocystis bainbridge]|uniref:Tetratricopeptide repeat protein n=1 Tax=Nannocystis bainbridge TaxID=2995303 RepID=A0ABT5EAF4_9BACT|nr:tetratricopeptide repeat protein [Nannocystis bainbridge]MDC0722834.1 tetratricopeptide repeat protein [Nannocystis bainbridge]
MPETAEMPLLEMLQVLSRTPTSEPQLRAVVAVTCARWCVVRGEDGEAQRLLAHALELVPDLRPAMRLLYRIFLRRGDIRNSVRYLDLEIRATRHPREAAALYRERGQLVETHFKDRAAALQCYQAALRATPKDLAVLRSVEAVTLVQGNLMALVANLEAQLEVLHDPRAVAAVARDLAVLETRQGGDLNLAAALLIAAGEEQPGNLLLIQDLFRVAEAAGNAELMLRALEAEADARPPEQRAGPLARASLVLREVRERAAAVSLLHAAAKLQPDNFSLWRNLEELAMATARYDVAVEACAGQLKAIGGSDPGTEAELFYRLGKLAMIRLDRVSEGLGAMRRALKLFPGHTPALEDAGRYLIANESWHQLLELLKLQVATAEAAGLSPEERAQAQLRAGQVLEENLKELEGARQLYEEAVASSQTYRPALDRLERVLLQLGRFDGLRELYSGELQRGVGGPRRVFLLSILARLHERQGDPSAAIKCLVALLKEFPEHLPSLQQLARLLARAGRARELLQVTEQEIKLTISPLRRAKLLFRSAELALQMGDTGHAEASLQESLEEVPDHPPTLALLERILRDRGDDVGIIDLLRRRLQRAVDPAQRLSLHLEILHRLLALGELPQALDEVDLVLQTWPEHLSLLHTGERLAAALGRTDALLGYLGRHFDLSRGQRARALLIYRAALVRASDPAGIWADPGQAEQATGELRRALAQWPSLGGGWTTLLEHCAANGSAGELLSAARGALAHERGIGNRQAAALLLAEMSDSPALGVQYLEAAAEARPRDLNTQLRLARAARFSRRPDLVRSGAAAALSITAEESADHPFTHSLRYRAARAAESAGDLDAADAGYAELLAMDARYEPARRAQARIGMRRNLVPTRRAAAELNTAAAGEKDYVERAALLCGSADLYVRAGDLDEALSRLNAALVTWPKYLPALHAKACLMEQRGSPADLVVAADLLAQIALLVGDPAHQHALCVRAGLLAVRARDPARAWRALARALDIEPASDPAFSALWRTREQHGREGAVPLVGPLTRRFDALAAARTLTPEAARALARVVEISDGNLAAAGLLERAVASFQDHVALRVDLARLYARAGRGSDAVGQLQEALKREASPELRAVLEFLLADAHERNGAPDAAFEHYLAASRGGFQAFVALRAADRIASAIGTVDQRVEVLQRLLELGDADERVRSLRALADIDRRVRGRPEEAAALLRELLRLRPANTEVILELHALLIELGRGDEARVALQAGIAAQRALLRDRGHGRPHKPGRPEFDGEGEGPIAGLLRLFDAAEESGGVYVCAAVLETVDPDLVPATRRCEVLQPAPWPLPTAPDKPQPFFTVDDPAAAAAVHLLQAGVKYMSGIPGAPPPPVNLAQRHSLPAASSVAVVTRALARTLGVGEPLLFLNPTGDDGVVAHVGTAPVLLIGRRINGAPFSPASREAIGRALFRLSTGGDHLHHVMDDIGIMAVLHGLASCAGVELDDIHPRDESVSDAIIEGLAGAGVAVDFGDDAEILARNLQQFSHPVLRDTLRQGEDRAGAIACGDPRVPLRRLTTRPPGDAAPAPTLAASRPAALVAYLVSEEHLALRRALGYNVELELELSDVEELPA